MYETLHTEMLNSEPMHGFIFSAQLLGGELAFGARLATPITVYGNDFYLGQYQWDSEHPPYTLDVGPEYEKAFKQADVQKWIKDRVEPWATIQKLQHIEGKIKYYTFQLEEHKAEAEKLKAGKG